MEKIIFVIVPGTILRMRSNASVHLFMTDCFLHHITASYVSIRVFIFRQET